MVLGNLWSAATAGRVTGTPRPRTDFHVPRAQLRAPQHTGARRATSSSQRRGPAHWRVGESHRHRTSVGTHPSGGRVSQAPRAPYRDTHSRPVTARVPTRGDTFSWCSFRLLGDPRWMGYRGHRDLSRSLSANSRRVISTAHDDTASARFDIVQS